jgi:apolipoprotein N-acyltransferase
MHDKYTYSPLICFEIAFPELTNRIAEKDADFIVNITNDAWFYRSAGTYQHAIMTRVRAVETRTQIFRCANTGYSMIVDPKGDVLVKSELFEQTIISGELYNYNGRSLYVDELFWYPYIFLFITGVFLGFSLIAGIRKK